MIKETQDLCYPPGSICTPYRRGLWQQLGGTDSVFHSQWPECDEEAMKDDEIEVAVQVNGKTRAVISVAADISKEDALAAGREAVKDKMSGNIVKEIYVPGKIINIVCR